mgnify:FL=1
MGRPNSAHALAIGCLLATILLVFPERATGDPDGARLFARYCAGCHGDGGGGDGPDADIFPSPPRDLRSGFLRHYDDATLARRIRDGRALPLVLDRAALQRHSNQVEAITRHLRRLPSIDWRVVEPGWAAYVDRCEECHGPTGEGPSEVASSPAPPDLAAADLHTRFADRLPRAVRHGEPGMTPLEPPVDPRTAAAISSFVSLFSPGFSAYSRYCANCHADDGRGSQTLGVVPGDILPMPSFAFDEPFFARRSPAALREAVWHMLAKNKPSMPHFRVVLTGEQANALVRHLRHLDARATP